MSSTAHKHLLIVQPLSGHWQHEGLYYSVYPFCYSWFRCAIVLSSVCCALSQAGEGGADSCQSQSSLAPVGGATSDDARPVGPKHDRSPEQMQVHNYNVQF